MLRPWRGSQVSAWGVALFLKLNALLLRILLQKWNLFFYDSGGRNGTGSFRRGPCPSLLPSRHQTKTVLRRRIAIIIALPLGGSPGGASGLQPGARRCRRRVLGSPSSLFHALYRYPCICTATLEPFVPLLDCYHKKQHLTPWL